METETAGLIFSHTELIISIVAAIALGYQRYCAKAKELKLEHKRITAEAAFDYADLAMAAAIGGLEQAERLAKAGLISNEEAFANAKLETQKLARYMDVERDTLAPAVQRVSEVVAELWRNKRPDESRPAPADIAENIREKRRSPENVVPNIPPAGAKVSRIPYPVIFAALLLIPLSGCQLLEPSLRQQADFTSYEYNQKLTPELAAQVDDLQVTTTVIETLDPETGKVISRRTVQDKTRGLPVVPGTTKILASEDFADTDRQITSTRDSIGSNLQINQTNAGNADTLNPAVQGQVARGAQQADFADKALSTLTRGVVDINRDNRQADVDKTKIEASRDVELAKFNVEEEEEHGEGEHTPEATAVEPVTEELPATD